MAGLRFGLREPLVLEKGEGDHRHQDVSVEACPGAAFEVVEPVLS